jgi:hypothetical protein
MTRGLLRASSFGSSHLMRRWFLVLAVFVLTWLAVATAVTVSHSLSGAPSQTSSEDRPVSTVSESATQNNGSGTSYTRTRGRIRTPGPQSNPQESELRKELREAQENGLLEHDIPSRLTVFQEQEIEVRLSRGPAAEKFLKDSSKDTNEIVSVRDFVSLSIYGGNNFDIQNLSPDPQSMRHHDYCLWKFIVTPKRGGKNNLEITVSLYDEPGYVPVASYRREVEVDVPFPARLALMWEDYRGGSLTDFMLPLVASVFTGWMTVRIAGKQEARTSEQGNTTNKKRAPAKRKARSEGPAQRRPRPPSSQQSAPTGPRSLARRKD